jgi:hypothetical protein
MTDGNQKIQEKLTKDQQNEDESDRSYAIDYIVMLHQQIYIFFVFGLIFLKFSGDATFYISSIIYNSINDILWSIWAKLKYICNYTIAIVKSYGKRARVVIKKIVKNVKAKKNAQAVEA